MTFEWDAKNNFILLHFINLHQQQSLTSDINWLSILNDIRLEISSTPTLLKTQYEYLLEIFYPKKESKSLYLSLKHIYLHSLCQKIEDDFKLTLETVYELIRHTRNQRINTDDIEKLIKEWNFNYSSDEQKENKNRLFHILNRLRDYVGALSKNSYEPINYELPEDSNTNELSTIEKDINDGEISTINKQSELISIDNNPVIPNTNEQEKPSFVRHRSQSLTLSTVNKDNKVNIGVEWFVPELKRQQRSSSLNASRQTLTSINILSSQNENFVSNGILITTVDNDESSESTSDSNPQQMEAHSTSSANEQTVENEHRQIHFSLIDERELEPVSASDSDSIEIQWSTSTNKKPAESSPSHDSHPQEHNSCKRQRLS